MARSGVDWSATLPDRRRPRIRLGTDDDRLPARSMAAGGSVRGRPARPGSAGRPPLFWLGSGLLGLTVAAAVLAPQLRPLDPRLPVALPLQPGSAAYPLGTNDLGQDNLGLLLYGARSTLAVAASVAATSTALSWLVGLLAGFARRLEWPLMALTDLLLALPAIPLYLLVVTLVGPSQTHLILALALLSWPSFARIVRSLVIQSRAAPYVEAARAIGASGPRIMLRHLLPATLDVLPTKLILTVRFAIFAETTLAFLGLADAGRPGWGTMLSWAFNDPLLFSRSVWPWLVLPPALAIAALVLATTWIAEGLTTTRSGGGPRERCRGGM